MNRQEKTLEIDSLTESFQSTKHAFLVGFQGLTVGADTALRSELRKANIRYQVVKNTLARRAAKGTALEVVSDQFVGPTAVAINPEDPIATAKLLLKFTKDHQKFVFKAGVLEGRPIEAKDLEALANMPSREELMSKLMFVVNSGAQRLASVTGGVARNLAVVVSQIRDQKEQNS
jgi:large subunit ribosomal protein L10